MLYILKPLKYSHHLGSKKKKEGSLRGKVLGRYHPSVPGSNPTAIVSGVLHIRLIEYSI